MSDVIIVSKKDPKAILLADEIEKRLTERVRIIREISSNDSPRAEIPPDFSPILIISIGGDGTLIHAASKWGLSGVPILGVNMGRLGFLAEIEPSILPNLLESALMGQALVEERSILNLSVTRDNQEINKLSLINEVVISKGNPARIISLTVCIDSLHCWKYRADGLILSTPTGSTAYNLSAGGPVVHPSLPAIIITPICPFSLSSRSLVLPLDYKITITLDDNDQDVVLTGDGQKHSTLRPGNVLKISQDKTSIRLIKNPFRHYLETLKVKRGLFNEDF